MTKEQAFQFWWDSLGTNQNKLKVFQFIFKRGFEAGFVAGYEARRAEEPRLRGKSLIFIALDDFVDNWD
jgi:hypothetical protein